jgi:hypothetical protein
MTLLEFEQTVMSSFEGRAMTDQTLHEIKHYANQLANQVWPEVHQVRVEWRIHTSQAWFTLDFTSEQDAMWFRLKYQ